METMTTFTAHEFAKNALKVYRTADKEGAVRINHSFYKDSMFILTCRPRGEDTEQEEE